MVMVSCTVSSWTLIGLIRSFIDLALAYFLLCGSTFGFFAGKFCGVFGLYLPCPCSGFFGYQNSNLCWHKLFIQWPIRKIYSVQNLALNRFPFDSVSFNHQELNSNARFLELEGEACSTSLSGLNLQTAVVDSGIGYDAKGKKAINHKQKSGTRRRKRAAFGIGKAYSPVLLSGSFPSSAAAAAGVSCSYTSGGETRSDLKDNFGPVTEIEDSLPDEKNTQIGTDMGEANRHGYELSSGEENGPTFMKTSTCNTSEKLGLIGDEADRVRMLEQALEEEKAKHAAVYLELEKERAASASAADEAMAMILRIQEDKASIELEARQYQRMIEDKVAYDEEEMNILKEILVRMEKENHLLERELEDSQMNNTGDDEEETDFSYTVSKERRPLVPLALDKDPLSMVKRVGKRGPTAKKDVGKDNSWHSKDEAPSSGERSHAAADYFADRAAGPDDDDIACQEIATKTVQSIEKTSLTGEKLKRDAKLGEPLGSNLHDPSFDTEPAIYDVHVVDDKIVIPKEENTKESQLPPRSASVHKTLLRTFSAASNEMLGIDAEIECLRERLKIVRGEKGKLTFSSDQRKRVDTHLKLIEELVNQLREFQQLKEPVWQTSLPPSPSSSKAGSNRRRCRSVSDDIGDSA